MQVFMYYRMYPNDRWKIRMTVRDYVCAIASYSDSVAQVTMVWYASSRALRRGALLIQSRLLDLLHGAMICLANWMYLIAYFGDPEASKRILWWD